MAQEKADWSLEAAFDGLVVGVDEAGRGPLAGPVVTAAVVIEPARPIDGLADSKTLSARRRAELAAVIWANAHVGVGVAEPGEIDRLNIRAATLAAMGRAICAVQRVCPGPVVAALVDGRDAPPSPVPVTTVIKGDARSVSIAAASIIAKVTRDAVMVEADARAPGYDFSRHAGYPTAAHRAALVVHGPAPCHRRSFAPVAASGKTPPPRAR